MGPGPETHGAGRKTAGFAVSLPLRGSCFCGQVERKSLSHARMKSGIPERVKSSQEQAAFCVGSLREYENWLPASMDTVRIGWHWHSLKAAAKARPGCNLKPRQWNVRPMP
eukprot:2695616-Rhodomonas_salina.1